MNGGYVGVKISFSYPIPEEGVVVPGSFARLKEAYDARKVIVFENDLMGLSPTPIAINYDDQDDVLSLYTPGSVIITVSHSDRISAL